MIHDRRSAAADRSQNRWHLAVPATGIFCCQPSHDPLFLSQRNSRLQDCKTELGADTTSCRSLITRHIRIGWAAVMDMAH